MLASAQGGCGGRGLSRLVRHRSLGGGDWRAVRRGLTGEQQNYRREYHVDGDGSRKDLGNETEQLEEKGALARGVFGGFGERGGDGGHVVNFLAGWDSDIQALNRGRYRLEK